MTITWHDSNRQKEAERLVATQRYHEARDALASACEREIEETAKEIRDRYAALRREAFERYLVERDAAYDAHDERVKTGGLRP